MSLPEPETESIPNGAPHLSSSSVLDACAVLAEAFDRVLCAAVTAIDTLDLIGEHLTPVDSPAAALVDHLKASIAAEALSVMERWPS